MLHIKLREKKSGLRGWEKGDLRFVIYTFSKITLRWAGIFLVFFLMSSTDFTE